MRFKLLLAWLALFLAPAAFAQLIPAGHLVDWTPGTSTGVPGGVAQYLPGGANQRTSLIDVTQPPYSADNTGASNATPAIQAAINAAAQGQVIYLPPGTYLIGDPGLRVGVYDGITSSNITIRGAGPGSTILVAGSTTSATPLSLGYGDDWATPVSILGAPAKGATVLYLLDASGFASSVGKLVRVVYSNETNLSSIQAGAAPVVHVAGWDNLRGQVSQVTAVTANSISISPGLYQAPESDVTAAVSPLAYGRQSNAVGLENFTIDMSNSSASYAIFQGSSYGCWSYNLKIIGGSNYQYFMLNSLQSEVRHCTFTSPTAHNGPNGGSMMVQTDSGLLFEDNIIYNGFPCIEVIKGSSGNAFSYNFFDNDNVSPIAIDTNHGPHNRFNLYEGNACPNIRADGFYGSVSDDTIFRNWITGVSMDNTVFSDKISLKRFSRRYNIVGNVVGKVSVNQGTFNYGQPNIGNGFSDGVASLSGTDPEIDWNMTGTLTTRTSDTSGVITLNSGSMRNAQDQVAGSTQVCLELSGTSPTTATGTNAFMVNIVVLTGGVNLGDGTITTKAGGTFSFALQSGTLPPAGTVMSIFPGPGGYQELDQDVAASTLDEGNYLYGPNGAAGAMSSLNGNSLPDSLEYSAKPAWFNSLAWPPYDPANPDASAYTSIPAGYRYVNNGQDPPGSSLPQAPTGLHLGPH